MGGGVGGGWGGLGGGGGGGRAGTPVSADSPFFQHLGQGPEPLGGPTRGASQGRLKRPLGGGPKRLCLSQLPCLLVVFPART